MLWGQGLLKKWMCLQTWHQKKRSNSKVWILQFPTLTLGEKTKKKEKTSLMMNRGTLIDLCRSVQCLIIQTSTTGGEEGELHLLLNQFQMMTPSQSHSQTMTLSQNLNPMMKHSPNLYPMRRLSPNLNLHLSHLSKEYYQLPIEWTSAGRILGGLMVK